MPKIYQGFLTAKDRKFGIVVSRFNEFISTKLLEGAMDCLLRHEAQDDNIEIAWVPGSFEIPIAAKKMASSGKYAAIICLGALIRGATPHFDYIAAEATKGIAHTSLEFGLPIAYGVLTTDTLEQAIERAGTKAGNKGWDAALSAIEMVDLFTKLKEE
ncbi:6,7-dimethyl-8-ribityllumazine synthase [candidate division KSB1 bacterium]|nr:6,7-dimethyl-8-ribityllumazine synthase [candidate division KSB1 bacterium]